METIPRKLSMDHLKLVSGKETERNDGINKSDGAKRSVVVFHVHLRKDNRRQLKGSL